MSGLFITLEGTDGSGKTTQINRLKEYFSERGYRVVCTREQVVLQQEKKLEKL